MTVKTKSGLAFEVAPSSDKRFSLIDRLLLGKS